MRTLDELLDSVLGAQQARMGTWQNDDMRRISAWAAIFAIPNVVAGVHGMTSNTCWNSAGPTATRWPSVSWRSRQAPSTGPSAATAGC
ncbi:hypothetical protein [Streptomyces sp. NBC_00207]|uniref:hypothetical protein n=1 Tax=unclassified Streptomyces TaxID=2593676 RepID=UPI00386F0ACD